MARHFRAHRSTGFGVVALALAGSLSACGGEQPLDSIEVKTPTTSLDGTDATAMRVYSPRGRPMDDEKGFVWLGPPETLGGKVLEGDPKIFARFDHMKGGMVAGLFKATTGKIEVTFPFTEHATILEGEVTITDGTGQTHTYKPGDSYLIRQGQVVLWEVKGKQVIKSFFNITEPQ